MLNEFSLRLFAVWADFAEAAKIRHLNFKIRMSGMQISYISKSFFMKPAITVMFFAIMILACNNQETTSIDKTASDSSAVSSNTNFVVDSTLSGCYSLIANRDTASLQIQIKDSTASGSLSYNLFEKRS